MATPASLNFVDCDSARVAAHLVNATGDSLGGGSFTFTTTGVSVATVSPAGWVRGVSPGSTSVIVHSGAFADTVPTGITASPDTTVVLPIDTIRVFRGDADTLAPTVLSCHGLALPGVAVSYHSANGATATVGGTGIVTGVAAGVTKISLSVAHDTITIPVKIYDSVHVAIDGAPAHASRPYGVAITSTGVVYVTRLDDAQIARYDLATRALGNDSIAVGGVPTGVAFRPDGAEAYVASQDGNIDIVKVSNDSVLKTVVIAGSGFNAAVSPDGSKAFLGTNMNKVYVFSTASRSIIDSLTAGGSPGHFAFSPSGATLYYSDWADGIVRHATVSTDALGAFNAIGGGPQGIAVGPGGGRLYVAREGSGDLAVVNSATGALIDSLPIPGGSPFGVAVQPATGMVWVTTLTGHIVVVNPFVRGIVGDTVAGGTLRRIAFAPGGSAGVVADEDGRVVFIH